MAENQIEIKPVNTSIVNQESTRVAALFDNAGAIVIRNQADYEGAAGLLSEIMGKKKLLNEKRFELTRPLDGVKAQIMELFRPVVDKLAESEKIVKVKIDKYDFKKKVEAEAAEAEARAKAKEKEEALQIKADEAIKDGNIAKAEKYLTQAENIPIPTKAPEAEAPKGISFVENWYAEVTDVGALEKKYTIPNQKLLDSIAQSSKGQFPIAGVRFYSKREVRYRTGT